MTQKTMDNLRMSTSTVIAALSLLVACVSGFNHLKFRIDTEGKTNKKQDDKIELLLNTQHQQDLAIQAANSNYATILEKQRDADGKLTEILRFAMTIERGEEKGD